MRFILITVIAVGFWALVISPLIRRKRAKEYVLAQKAKMANRFAVAEESATSPDVKKEVRLKLKELSEKFSPVSQLTSKSKVKWKEELEKFISINSSLNNIESEIRFEISFARRARENGPKLMREIPETLDSTERKLAEGIQSMQAQKYLEEAHSLYKQALIKRAEMTKVDWVALYVILKSAQSHTDSALVAHRNENMGRKSTGVGYSESL